MCRIPYSVAEGLHDFVKQIMTRRRAGPGNNLVALILPLDAPMLLSSAVQLLT